jgi:hypothetical protein
MPNEEEAETEPLPIHTGSNPARPHPPFRKSGLFLHLFCQILLACIMFKSSQILSKRPRSYGLKKAVLLTRHVAGMQSESEDSNKNGLASFCECSPANEKGS